MRQNLHYDEGMKNIKEEMRLEAMEDAKLENEGRKMMIKKNAVKKTAEYNVLIENCMIMRKMFQHGEISQTVFNEFQIAAKAQLETIKNG
jgi:hypothetical protein